jgi:hypothetical protein
VPAVLAAEALPELTDRFVQTQGWTGGDGAATVSLGDGRVLWLFADTWIGKIENGRRTQSRMVNNTAAVQSAGNPDAPPEFYWKAGADGPESLLTPAEKDLWYWPHHGVLVGGKLYVFCNVLSRNEEGEPGFQFRSVGCELVRVENPADEPTAWRYERRRMHEPPDGLRLYVAGTVDGDYLYAYALLHERSRERPFPPLAVGRIPLAKLEELDADGWEYWCVGPDGGGVWRDRPAEPMPLFRDAAPEMTVSRVPGVDGFVAVYTQLGLGRDIVVRHAPRPEGPWSEAVKAYRCPDEGDGLLIYGAKAHPALTDEPGELIVTYCRNVGDLGEHVRRPEVYFPQAIRLRIRVTGETVGR